MTYDSVLIKDLNDDGRRLILDLINDTIDDHLIEDQHLIPGWGQGLIDHLVLQTQKNRNIWSALAKWLKLSIFLFYFFISTGKCPLQKQVNHVWSKGDWMVIMTLLKSFTVNYEEYNKLSRSCSNIKNTFFSHKQNLSQNHKASFYIGMKTYQSDVMLL